MSHDGVTIEPPEDLGDPTRELDKEDFKSNHVDLTMGPEILQLWRSFRRGTEKHASSVAPPPPLGGT